MQGGGGLRGDGTQRTTAWNVLLCCSGGGPMNLLVLIILLSLVVGALPAWPYSQGWGYYPSGAFGLLLLILLVMTLTRSAP
jgi:hypothetical protein